MGSMTNQRRRLNRRWRHPCDKGEPAQRKIGEVFRYLLEAHTWKRHPEPFAKTLKGKNRRMERRFVLDMATRHIG
jgi:hypothetical protein